MHCLAAPFLRLGSIDVLKYVSFTSLEKWHQIGLFLWGFMLDLLIKIGLIRELSQRQTRKSWLPVHGKVKKTTVFREKLQSDVFNLNKVICINCWFAHYSIYVSTRAFLRFIGSKENNTINNVSRTGMFPLRLFYAKSGEGGWLNSGRKCDRIYKEKKQKKRRLPKNI